MSAQNNHNTHDMTRILLPTGVLYILFSALTAVLGTIGLIIMSARNTFASPDFWPSLFYQLGLEGATEAYLAMEQATIMPVMPDIPFLRAFDILPDGFTFFHAARNHVLPEGFLQYIFIFLIAFAVVRLAIGVFNILFGKKPEKGAFLGLLGKIDLWIVILLTVFILYFVDGFGFIWFPIISFAPAMLLLHGSAKLDNRPGKASREEARTAKLFLIPAFLGLTFFTYIPLMATFVISLFDWRIPFMPEFMGLTNFIELLAPDSSLWTSMRITLTYALLAVVLGMVYSMCIALLLNRKIPGRAFFRTVFLLPFAIPMVSSLVAFHLIYSHGGIINSIIDMFGG